MDKTQPTTTCHLPYPPTFRELRLWIPLFYHSRTAAPESLLYLPESLLRND